jgi:hypothetical protein
MKFIDDYENGVINSYEAHNWREAARWEGLLTGKQAREEGVRASYVPRRIKSWLDNFLRASLFAIVAGTSSDALASEKIVVLDITASVPQTMLLAERVFQNIELDYGDSVEVFALGCQGLSFIYRGEVLKRSKANHRRSLKQVEEKLKQALFEAAKSDDNRCSPILDAMVMLSADVQVRAKQNIQVSVIIGSDFETNADKTKIKGKPFSNIDAVAVLPVASGKNPAVREKAHKFVNDLFSGSKSLKIAY